MAQIDISARVVGDKELAAALAKMSSADIPTALKHGVRVAARGARTVLGKEISARYAIGSGRVKKDVTQPTYQQGGLTAIIRTSRKPPTAMQFKARETRKGLAFTQIKGERTVIKSGFIAKGLPFKRMTKKPYPLDVVHGPSIYAIYTGGRYAQQLQKVTEERVAEQLVSGTLQRLRAMGRGFGG